MTQTGQMRGEKTEISARRILAENLRIIRLFRNLSQEALADLAGLDRSYISSIERGKRNLSLDNVERLSHALGISILELLSEQDDQQLASQVLEAIRSAVDGVVKRRR